MGLTVTRSGRCEDDDVDYDTDDDNDEGDDDDDNDMHIEDNETAKIIIWQSDLILGRDFSAVIMNVGGQWIRTVVGRDPTRHPRPSSPHFRPHPPHPCPNGRKMDAAPVNSQP